MPAQADPLSLLRQHPLREALAHEVHARPFAALRAPVRASHLAVLSGEDATATDYAHVVRLCTQCEVAPPPERMNHVVIDLGPLHLKWERHTEFSTYTFFRQGPFTDPFDHSVMADVPRDWLADLPGEVLVAVHVALMARDAPAPALDGLGLHPDSVVGSLVSGGAAQMWTDFRIHEDGFGRILVRDVSMTERQAGRLVQRLLEIETYRVMALLALPMTRQTSPKVSAVERGLAEITARLADLESLEDERVLLGRLTHLAGDIERVAASTNYRFGAARAYYALVERRTRELREERVKGLQTIAEFMDRRLAPAMRTCESMAARIEALSQRIARASNLLRTRVDIALEGQNRDLLRSMDRRARLQLRLQQTVEGLSVVAISYYLLGLVGYGAKALKAAGVPLQTDIAVGVAVPAVVALVWFGVRRVRRAVTRS